MPKVKWTQARWAKRAQKARALAKNTRKPVRRRMMLEVAEFYDRLAKLTQDFKSAGETPLARPRDRSKLEARAVRPLVAAKPNTLPVERKRPVGASRTAKRPQGRRRTSPQKATCGCAAGGSDWHRAMVGSDQPPPTLEVKEFSQKKQHPS
jgi:hypothetical protein